jgi:hypothetical protein
VICTYPDGNCCRVRSCGFSYRCPCANSAEVCPWRHLRPVLVPVQLGCGLLRRRDCNKIGAGLDSYFGSDAGRGCDGCYGGGYSCGFDSGGFGSGSGSSSGSGYDSNCGCDCVCDCGFDGRRNRGRGFGSSRCSARDCLGCRAGGLPRRWVRCCARSVGALNVGWGRVPGRVLQLRLRLPLRRRLPLSPARRAPRHPRRREGMARRRPHSCIRPHANSSNCTAMFHRTCYSGCGRCTPGIVEQGAWHGWWMVE